MRSGAEGVCNAVHQVELKLLLDWSKEMESIHPKGQLETILIGKSSFEVKWKL